MPSRPPGKPVMFQTWADLLFAHWPVDVDSIRARIPETLEVDTFEGQAWIGLVPFVMRDIRHRLLPPVPGLSAMAELNVRTYVRYRGEPGVWFFSLDASNPLMVWGARTLFHLPYLWARMKARRTGDRIEYQTRRIHPGAPKARLDMAWKAGAPLPASEPGSLQHFLTERYCLYTAHGSRLYQGRIDHTVWPLRTAELLQFDSTVLHEGGFEPENTPPLLHHSDRLEVEIWPLEVVGEAGGRRWRVGSS